MMVSLIFNLFNAISINVKRPLKSAMGAGGDCKCPND
jgi:hypothetical protein